MARFLKVLLICSCLFMANCTTPEPGDEAVTASSDEMEGDVSEESTAAASDEDFDDEVESEETATNESAPAEEPAAADENVEEELAAEEELADPVAETPAEEPAVEPAAPVEQNPIEEPTQATAPISNPGALAIVTDIDFLANQSGGTIAVKTSSPAQYSTRYNEKTQQYIIELQSTQLSSAMKRPFIMKDFVTSFGAINAYQTPGSNVARIVVQMKGGGEPLVQQEGTSLLILPPTSSSTGLVAASGTQAWEKSYDVEAAQKEEALGARSLDEFLTGSSKFYGRPISIQINDAEVRDVISFIADESGVNLVLGEDVDGKISLKLRDVPWDQALVIVMKAKGLGYVRQGSVIRITKLATLQSEAQLSKSIVDAQKILSPLRVKVIPVSYATVSELEAQVKSFLTPERGKVVSDGRTSSLIVTDTAEVLEKIGRLVRELDIPPAQVMIEGKVVEAGESFSRTLGVNWGFGGTSTELASGGGLNGSPLNMTVGFQSQSLQANQLSALNGNIGLRIGAFDFFGDLNAQLALAQSDSMVRIISSPRIVTINKQPAEILQKGEVITVERTVDPNTGGATQATSTARALRTPVQLKLNVTPQVTNEGSVILDVDVLREFAGSIADTTTQARPVNSRSAKTKVMVPNGQTAVIGGIYQNDEQSGESGVPVLKDIPVLGWLFKSKIESREKNELIIFLTPRILNAKDQAVTQ
jgi:type IV pilus assembly protein PilQ